MNLEKFTDRARGFLQSAQTVAIRMNHQRIAPEHLLKALLEDEQGMAAGPDRRAPAAAPRRRGARPTRRWPRSRRCRAAAPARRRRSTARRSGCSTRPSRSPRRPATATSPSSGCCSRWRSSKTDAGKALQPTPGSRPRRSTPRSTSCAAAAPPTPQSAEDRYDALKKFARDLTQAARDGKLDPVIGRDEEIRRTDPDPRPPHQEQSGADRRARRRQDRDRRRPGAAHRQWRRARQPQGPPADGARHGLR